MKRILAAVFLVVVSLTLVTLIALDHEAKPSTGAVAEPSAEPEQQVVIDEANLDEAIKGYKLLLDLEIDQPASDALVAGGLRGARTYAAGGSVLAPEFLPDTEDALRDALRRVILDNPRVDQQQLLFAFIEGMTAALNERHTVFLRPDTWNDLKDNQRPNTGYSATNTDAGRLVWLVEPNSPAADAGLKPGDTITAVNDVSLGKGSSGNIAAVIGRTDVLSVRGPDGRARTVRLTPARVSTAIDSRLLIGGIAYLRIASFIPPGENEVFISQLDAAMQALSDEKPIGWIVDLRGNGGGIVSLANYTAGWLGYNGIVADVSVRPDAHRVRPFTAEGKLVLNGRPLVVLLNRRSASSSEILAEALREAGLARIVGEPSAGSVRLAQYHEVANGALQIAFADVNIGPERVNLDKKGIQPDVAVDLDAADLANGIDAQLDRAIALIAGQ
jgi:carboxyl-terminal processing protease